MKHLTLTYPLCLTDVVIEAADQTDQYNIIYRTFDGKRFLVGTATAAAVTGKDWDVEYYATLETSQGQIRTWGGSLRHLHVQVVRATFVLKALSTNTSI